jgi:hypothetical protein
MPYQHFLPCHSFSHTNPISPCAQQDEYQERCQRGELVNEANGSSYLFVAKEPIQLLVPLRVSGQHKIWKLPAKTAAMARASLGSMRSLQKHSKSKKAVGTGAPVSSQAELDESNDIAVALAASLKGKEPSRLPGDVGVVANLSVVNLLPTRPPPCALSVLPHSADPSQLTVEVLQEGMAIVRGFLSPREQQEIVNRTAALGVGDGGFYIPSYGSRGAQKLFMMNLGWHWNLQVLSPKLTVAFSQSSYILMAYRVVGPSRACMKTADMTMMAPDRPPSPRRSPLRSSPASTW